MGSVPTIGQPDDLSSTLPAAPTGVQNNIVQAETPTALPTTVVRHFSSYTPPAIWQQNSYVYAADTGSANAYAVALSPAPTVIAGFGLLMKIAHSNTGASTIAVNGGSATSIKKGGSTALASGDFVAGQFVMLIYDGTYYQVVGLAAASGGGGGGGGGFATLPALSAFTWVNQNGGASATATQSSTYTTNGPITLYLPYASALNWKGLFQNVPGSTPWKIQAQMSIATNYINSNDMGLYLYDGTKLVGLELLIQTAASNTGMGFRVEHITNVTTDGATQVSGHAGLAGTWWLQIRCDGTNYYFDWSIDGANWFNLWSEAIGAYITATKIGFGGVNVSSGVNLYIALLQLNTFSNATL